MVLGSGRGVVGGPTAIGCAATGDAVAADGLGTGELVPGDGAAEAPADGLGAGEAATGETTGEAATSVAVGAGAGGAWGPQAATASAHIKAELRSPHLIPRRSELIFVLLRTPRQYQRLIYPGGWALGNE